MLVGATIGPAVTTTTIRLAHTNPGGPSTVGWIGIVSAGAAVIAAAFAVIGYIGRRQRSGASRHPAMARGADPRVAWAKIAPPVRLPDHWNSETVRWTPIRLVSYLDTEFRINGPERVRVGLRRRKVKTAVGPTGGIPLPPRQVSILALVMYDPDGWGDRKHALVGGRWTTIGGDTVNLRRRLPLLRLPDASDEVEIVERDGKIRVVIWDGHELKDAPPLIG